MPLFVQNKEGIVEMHASDCETCDTWTQGTVSEPEPDIEEIIAKAAGCSLVAWQSMTEEEGDQKLKKACKRRARAQRQKRRKEQTNDQVQEGPWRMEQKKLRKEEEERSPGPDLPPLPVGELPTNYTWRVPSKQDLLDTQAAWIVHENQERRKELLERASAKMAEALTLAGSLMAEAIQMLNEI